MATKTPKANCERDYGGQQREKAPEVSAAAADYLAECLAVTRLAVPDHSPQSSP